MHEALKKTAKKKFGTVKSKKQNDIFMVLWQRRLNE
jgi:hypothetical protein